MRRTVDSEKDYGMSRTSQDVEIGQAEPTPTPIYVDAPTANGSRCSRYLIAWSILSSVLLILLFLAWVGTRL